MQVVRTRAIPTLAVLLACGWLSPPAGAQSPPTDLTELDLEQILALHIKRADEPKRSRWRIAYRFLHANFDGNRDGTADIPDEEVLFRLGTEDRTRDNFPIVPLTIVQKAHMFDVGFDFDEKWQFSLLLPYITQETDHISIVPGFDQFIISSSGIGDILLSATHAVWSQESHVVLASLGISLPIGSIDEIGPTPREPGTDTQLPFTMQIGSGTYDLAPSLTYAAGNGDWSWGGLVRNRTRLGENNRNYRLGDSLTLSAWLTKPVSKWLAPSAKLVFRSWGRIEGRDEELLPPNLPPEFPFPAAVTDPSKFGGKKLNLHGGSRLTWPGGWLANGAFEGDIAVPIYQSLNGPQPKEIWRCEMEWSWNL